MFATSFQRTKNRFVNQAKPKRPFRRQQQRLLLEQLENRVTPSILGTFELDGNATTGVLGTSGSTTTSHDWDQVFADTGSSTSGTCNKCATSGALTASFVTDKVTSNSDDIFTGGGSKDISGIQQGPWLFTSS